MAQAWLHAFVLHRRPYRETSFIVDFFCAELGKVAVVAKGVRNAKSDRKSLLQPFQSLVIQSRGKSDLKSLTHVEAEAPAMGLYGDALYCGLYVNELINRVLPAGMEVKELYECYKDTLAALSQQQPNLELALRQFELTLLQELGVMPDLLHDAQSHQPILPNAFYHWAPELGFCDTPVANANANANAFAGGELLAIAAADFSPESLRAAKRLCRLALRPFLGDKPLKSRELFFRGR